MSAHGKRSRYVTGCRCFPCRLSNARYQRVWETHVRRGDWQGLRSSARAKRMIRSLVREGFTMKELAKRMGVTKIHLKRQIQVGTERRIEAFYKYYVREVA